MASWILIPSLASLRNEFNTLAPNRDKASDGSIGDTAHAQSSSDHNPDETGATPYEDADDINEVHAIDVDDDLKRSEWTMQKCLDIIVARHRSGADDRLQYIIYNRRIISRSWDWSDWHPYSGASTHEEHAHFSARYDTARENNTRPWGLLTHEEEAMAFIENQTDFNKALAVGMEAFLKSSVGHLTTADAVWNTDDTIPAPGRPTEGNTHLTGSTYLLNTYAGVNAIRAALDAGNAADAARDAALQAALNAGGSPAEFAAALAPYLPGVDEETVFRAFERAFAKE